MKTLHSKILWGLGIPVILFVIVLLVINFLYVDYQLKELTYAYVDSIAREADNKLSVQVKEIEELTRVLAAHLKQDHRMDASEIQELLNNLLEADEKYRIFIARKPLVIEGHIQGGNQSQLRRRNFNHGDEAKYRHYLAMAHRLDIWSRLRLEDGNWKTSYIVPFAEASEKPEGIIVVDVLLYELVRNLLNIRVSENARILFSAHQADGETKTLLLDAKAPNKIELLAFNLSDKIDFRHSFDTVHSAFKFSTDTAQIDDPLDGKGQIFVAQLPSGFSPNVQLIALLPKEEMFMYIYRAKLIESITVLIAFLGLVLLTLLISKSISKPISLLSGQVAILASGNLNLRFPETDSCLELDSLSRNLNQTVKQLKNYFSDLKRATSQNEKINSEINISHDVQMALLPRRTESTKISGIDIHGCTLPAKEVGGDFYYFFKIDQHRVALVIGDVSGKSMPAAIMMAVCLSLFKAQSANTPQPDVCLQKINQFLMHEDTSQCIFVTLFYALINTADGEMTYANAGHNPPLIVRKDGSAEFLEQQHGIPLAVAENVRYKAYRETLSDGDMLLLYTDGITEAHNLDEEEFGEQRLVECLSRHGEITAPWSAKRCVQNIVRRVAQFVRGCVQFDDMTLLCAVMHEAQTRPVQHITAQTSFGQPTVNIAELHNLQSRYRITIGYDIKEINKTIALVDSFCDDYRVNREIAADLCVVLDEFVSNVIRHGESGQGADPIRIRLAKKENVLLAILEYKGKAFDPLQTPAVDIPEDWRQRRIGGLGIHIGRQLTDCISYNYIDGRNILVVEKKLQNRY